MLLLAAARQQAARRPGLQKQQLVVCKASPRAPAHKSDVPKTRKKTAERLEEQRDGQIAERQQEVVSAPSPAPPLAQEQPTPVGVSLAYHTGWREPLIHYSLCGAPWRAERMGDVASGGGQWKEASFRVNGCGPAAAEAPLLEFVITNGAESWDKAPDGSNYVLTRPGRFALRHGSLTAPAAPAVLVVTDLDDTLIGDDAATAAFQHWWLDQGVAAGGRLVANTGRALDLFLRLLEEKGHVMPQPDLLISALGTRVYTVTGGQWREDEGYTASLGAGWNLEAVREACYAAVAAAGWEAMHFRPSEELNDHKITCGVRCDVLEQSIALIRAPLDAAGVAYKLVVSGSGGWRFVDLVPPNAGKLHALEYARQALGFPPERTVACGDSGNDIAMLEGQHKCIVVGNAQPDLLEWVTARRAAAAAAAGEGAPFEVLLARGHRAWGILEGLEHFGFKR